MIYVNDRTKVLGHMGVPLATVKWRGGASRGFDRVPVVEKRADAPREQFGTAVVLAEQVLRVCDIPSYIVERHYDPDMRSHEALAAKAKSKGLTARTLVSVVLFMVDTAHG